MPTNALELLEVSAMRRGLAEGLVETRRPPQLALDVLLQHLTSLACGPGFEPQGELAAVCSAWSFRALTGEQWQWCLDFLEHGGQCLGAYPRYRKLVRDGDTYRVVDRAIARLHRFNIGTITANRSVTVRFVRGAVIGQVEEAFIGRLKPGDVFFFAGRQLEFVRLREMTAQVKATSKKSTAVPAWAGGQMALSDLLSQHLRAEVDRCAQALASDGDADAGDWLDTPELQALEPLLRRQADLSRLPRQQEFLMELCRSREGSHLFAYPFEGRFVHEGIGFLWAWRLARHRPSTITVSVNDYGFELLAPKGYPFEELLELHGDDLLERAHLAADLEQAVNLSELCRRRFRAIAQVSGLITQAMPGQAKTGGQLQISAALLFDVFQKHEPGHLLLEQARREVIEEQLELPRLQAALERLAGSTWQLERTPRPGPLAFPLLVERLNNRLSNESVLERVQRLIAEANRAEALSSSYQGSTRPLACQKVPLVSRVRGVDVGQQPRTLLRADAGGVEVGSCGCAPGPDAGIATAMPRGLRSIARDLAAISSAPPSTSGSRRSRRNCCRRSSPCGCSSAPTWRRGAAAPAGPAPAAGAPGHSPRTGGGCPRRRDPPGPSLAGCRR